MPKLYTHLLGAGLETFEWGGGRLGHRFKEVGNIFLNINKYI